MVGDVSPKEDMATFLGIPYITYWCVLRREWMGCWGLLGVAGMIIDS